MPVERFRPDPVEPSECDPLFRGEFCGACLRGPCGATGCEHVAANRPFSVCERHEPRPGETFSAWHIRCGWVDARGLTGGTAAAQWDGARFTG